MKTARAALCLLGLGLASAGCAADDLLERLEDSLTWSAFDAAWRMRLSGTLDLEQYHFQPPAPALIATTKSDVFNPRLALFLDAQLGARVYVFAQARLDRGFDPGYEETQVRLDEYAVRVTPRLGTRMHFQIGKFATIVGNWVPRHDAWTNPFITAPLPYENLTGMWDFDVVHSANQLLQWAHVRNGLSPVVARIEKERRLPVIWGPSYALGAAAFGSLGKFSYALEVKNSPLSSRPAEWNNGTAARWAHPTISGRWGFRPNEMWRLGWSASSGSYLRAFTIPGKGHGRGDYRETTLGQDVGFAWHHWQMWTEIFATRFAIPNVGDADTLAYYTEVKYKLTPQLSTAIRWNQQMFGSIPERGARVRWGREVWRLDLAPSYRFTAHTQLKLQYSLAHEAGAGRDYAHEIAAQVTLRF